VILVGGKQYELVQEHKDAWKPEAFKERYSEVLERYDYIVGDWGYNQLRLKGFFKEGSNRATKDSGIASLQDYLQEYCNFGCAYFILERVEGKGGEPEGIGSLEAPSPAVAEVVDALTSGTGESPDEEKLAEEEQPVLTGIPGIAGGMAFSDRKPYSWREHQSASRSNRSGADKAEVAGGKLEGGTERPERRQDGRGRGGDGGGNRYGGGRGDDGRGGGRPNRSGGDRERERSYGQGAPGGERGNGGRPQESGEGGAGGGRKFQKGPRQGGGPNKGRGAPRPEGGPREAGNAGGQRHTHVSGQGGGNRERAQQRHHHKPQQNQ
jgi:uncharacterized protein YutD